MRRSPEPRVPSQGELIFDAGTRGTPTKRAAIVNLSRGGVCARGMLPAGPADALVEEGAVLRVALGFADGTPPVAADARIAWVEPPRRATDEACTFGLCFVDLASEDRERLSAAVAAREDAPVHLAPNAIKEARLRIDDGPTLRARAESADETGAIIGAELPWLRIGAQTTGEIDGAPFQGRIAWVGLDVSAAGIARLQLRLAFDAGSGLGKSARRDVTLPYFSTEEARAELPDPTADASADGEPSEVAWFEDRSRPVAPTTTAIVVRERKDATGRAHALVQIGTRRRRRLAMLRAAVVVLSLSALFLIARAFLRPPSVAPPERAPISAAPVEDPAAVVTSPVVSPVASPKALSSKTVKPRAKKPIKRAR